MLNLNLENVEEVKEYTRLPAGGYVARITSVKNLKDKEYLKVEYDIAEGEFKDYYGKVFDAKNFWAGSFIKSYKESALPFFKGFITSIENSNTPYKWDNDETKLVGKRVGIVLSEEEYMSKDHSIKSRLAVTSICSVSTIKAGKFTIAAKKELKDNETSAISELRNKPCVDDKDLPF